MYYLFEYRTSEGNNLNTYVPYRCIEELDPNSVYNKGTNGKPIIDRLNKAGFVHKYQSNEGWKTIYLNITHENVIYGIHYKETLELIKEYNRRTNLETLLTQ